MNQSRDREPITVGQAARKSDRLQLRAGGFVTKSIVARARGPAPRERLGLAPSGGGGGIEGPQGSGLGLQGSLGGRMAKGTGDEPGKCQPCQPVSQPANRPVDLPRGGKSNRRRRRRCELGGQQGSSLASPTTGDQVHRKLDDRRDGRADGTRGCSTHPRYEDHCGG